MFGFKKKTKKPAATPADEPKVEEKPKEDPVVVNPPEEKKPEPEKKPELAKEPAKKAEPKEEEAEEDRGNGAYFVSPHPDGGWQVKKAKAKKALKRFDTKAEAEKYAKQVAKNQDSSVVRQKKDGKIQKKH